MCILIKIISKKKKTITFGVFVKELRKFVIKVTHSVNICILAIFNVFQCISTVKFRPIALIVFLDII